MCAGLTGPFPQRIAQPEAAPDHIAPPARSIAAALSIREYSDALAGDFYRINAAWIQSMFTMEPNDHELLSHPRELIIDRGGVILFVEAEGLGVIGTCALMKIREGCFELTKMGVLDTARGQKAGEFLLREILRRAEAMQIETLYLLTSTKCAAAIHLYEKLGFLHDADIKRSCGSRYQRCDVAMSFGGWHARRQAPRLPPW
jgi:N-acetylglutamate synthase-like GNAT family acetyltransferase